MLFSASVIPLTFQGSCCITYLAYILLFSNLHHPCTIRQCVCGKKRRTKGSVVQELCNFVILSIMTDSAYFVKSTPLGVLVYLF